MTGGGPRRRTAARPSLNRDSPDDRIARVLRHELSLGFADRAVVGGLDKFVDNVAAQAPWLREEAPMRGRRYAELAPGEREAWIGSVLRRLEHSTPARPTPTPAMAKRPAKPAAVQPARGPLPLDTPLEKLPFLTKAQKPKFARMGIATLRDLIWLFPSRFIDYSRVVKLAEIQVGVDTTVVARVLRTEVAKIGPPPGAAKALVNDGTGLMTVTWFRQAYLAERLRRGQVLALSGQVEEWRGQAQMQNPEYEELPRMPSDGERPHGLVHAWNLMPVYPSTEGLQQRAQRNAARSALSAGVPSIREHLPRQIIDSRRLVGLTEAIEGMHFPYTPVEREEARRRLAFDELFINQLIVLQRKAEWRGRVGGVRIPDGADAARGFIEGLEFTLTDDQRAVLKTIFEDMATGVPMGRLLQGEVGSGKTVVALASILACVANGHTGALMAPTEVLAEQHFIAACRQLGALDASGLPDTVREAQVPGLARDKVRVGLLIGSLAPGLKRETQRLIAEGAVDIVIGTHALMQEQVDIPRLALAVVDEQHRFGVEQRAALTKREPRPHLLAMSATPIPRSLALTMFGDLEASTLKQMPHGKRPVTTKWARSEQDRENAYELVKREVAKGRQAFVVCPLIDHSEAVDARAATVEYELLSKGVLSSVRVGLLHGRMPLKEKQAVMEAFRSRDLDVLVATQVIEVGVDIPNATVMLIESADRFGLAQLHQLRGRVGRGGEDSFCVLLSDQPSADARERLGILERSEDGFELAEEDLRLRGPGDYVGTRQSGWSNLKVATPADFDILAEARDAAAGVIDADPALERPEHKLLGVEVRRSAEGRPAEFS